jgi:hypothetical protein
MVEEFSVYHKCDKSRDDRIEPIGVACKKTDHVHCGICKFCNNEFHLMKRKYVPSFDVT